MANGNDLYNNWTLEGYNNAYGNTGNTDRFPNQGNLYKQFDQDMNFRGPDPFGSFRSGIGSFYNQRPVYPGQRNIHEGFGTADVSSTFPPPTNTNTFMDTLKGFKGPVLSVLEKLKYTRPEAKQTAYDAITGSMDDQGYGTYKGNQYRLEGNKIYSELNPQGLNFDSGFGSKSVEEMDQKKLDWAMNRYEQGKGLSKRLRDILISRGLVKKPTNIDLTQIQDPGKGGVTVDTSTTGGPVTTGGGGVFNPAMDPKGQLNTSNTWHGATKERQAAGKQVAGPGGGSGAYWAKGGRVGYNRGRVVNPGGYAGEEVEEFEDENTLDFMRDQGVPHSEMAEGPSPFELRIQELVDTGMSWQEAYTIAAQEFGMAEGQEDSFSEEGIASLV